MADWVSRRYTGEPFRTYQYSRGGYRKLLQAAGFGHIQFYGDLPQYRHPHFYIPLDGNRAFGYFLGHLWGSFEEGASQRAREYRWAYRLASAIYERNPDWVTFFREVLGVDGIVRRTFPNANELTQFEQSEQYAGIQQLLAQLRDRSKHPNEKDEPTRVITVRLPKSLHESLRHEAHERKTSMNQLCISKLLQIIDNTLVPRD